jgi:hypothetical protein
VSIQPHKFRGFSRNNAVILLLGLEIGSHNVLFHFKLTDGRIVEDIEGLELSDFAAARQEAVGLAHDLTRMRILGRDWSKWTVVVADDSGGQVLSVPITENSAGN